MFLVSLATFWPSRDAAFVWDDQPYNLAGNSAVMRGDYAFFWKHPYRDFYIPVTYTVWTAVAAMTRDPLVSDSGLNPETFRTLNLFTHAANVVLVFWLLCWLVDSFWPAVLGAALFAVHPLQVESVVWVSELRGLLAGFFSLMALLFHCRYRRTGNERIGFAVAAGLCFAVAMLSKPSATALPLVVIALDHLFYRMTLKRPGWLVAAVWTAVAIPVMIFAKRVQPDASVEFIPALPARLLVAADALTFYIGKTIVPWPLSPSYGRMPLTILSWRIEDGLLIIPFALAWLTWRLRRKWPGVTAGAAIALVSLGPVLGFLPFKGQNFSTVADRYMYVPLVGVALAVAAVAARSSMNRLRWLMAGAFLAALLGLNLKYQSVWRDELTLWRHAATTYPNQPRVHNNYGAALQVAGLQDEAITQFDLALRARPDFADAYCNRGSSLGRLHRYSEALSDQTQAILLDPSDGGCWYNRAVTWFNLGRFNESMNDIEQAELHGYQLPAGFADAVRRRIAVKAQ